MAVFNKQKQWHPNWIFCLTGFVLIWSISCGISTPIMFSYETIKVYIIPEREEDMYEGLLCLVKNGSKVGRGFGGLTILKKRFD